MTDKPTNNEVHVFAPATVANVSCGFDVMGFALHEPGDEIIARRVSKPGVRITNIRGDGGALPISVDKNTAGVAAKELLSEIDFENGIELEIHKKMPLGSGLGSSAASAVGAVVAVNELLDTPFKKEKLLTFVAEAERVACGTPHLDNVAPSLMGGIVFIRSQNPPDITALDCPLPLFAVVVHPHIEIRTEDTRKILRRNIALSKAVTQWGNVGGLVAGLLKGDYDLISRSLEDVVVEPIRSVLIPGFDEVKRAAIDAGALGAGISGSGPSIFALAVSKKQAQEVAKQMQNVFDGLDLENEAYVSPINREGPKIIERS